jgi:hypothetical protein
MTETPTTTPITPTLSDVDAAPTAVVPAAAMPAPSQPESSETRGIDFASQIDALLADVESASTNIHAAVSEETETSSGKHAAALVDDLIVGGEDDAHLIDQVVEQGGDQDRDQSGDQDVAVHVPQDVNQGTDLASDSLVPLDVQLGAQLHEQIDSLAASLGADPALASGHADAVDHAAEALDQDLVSPPVHTAVSDQPPPHTTTSAMIAAIVDADSTPPTPTPVDTARDDIASQVSSLLASLPEVIGKPEPQPSASEDTAASREAIDNAFDPAEASAALGDPAAGNNESIDEQIETLTNTLIQSESLTTEKLAEMISPDPVPAGRAAGGTAASTELQPHQILRSEAAEKPEETEAAEAPSLHVDIVKGPPLSARISAMLASIGAAIGGTLAGMADGLSASLVNRPAFAKGLGWISLNTIFLAGCLWAFLIFVRLPALENVKASSFDFSHGTLPAPAPVHAADHKEGDGHGDDAGHDAHGADAATKDDGHGGKKTTAKKEPIKNIAKKREPAKKDTKKDAKPASGGH